MTYNGSVAPGQQVAHPGQARALPVRISTEALAAIQDDIALLERFVQQVLEPDADWGRVRGIPVPFLWEPGADKIISSYKSYSRPIVLRADIDEEKKSITYMIMAEVVSRDTQQVVTTGIGVCSTKEGKYGARWVERPEDYGYELKGLRKRTDEEGVVWYRIPNPEWGDLVHTLADMAYKRARAEAAQSLPGVGTALRKLFGGKTHLEPRDVFPHFWGEMRSLEVTRDQVHQWLGVKSLHDWVESHTLNEARDIIIAKLNEVRAAAATPVQGKTSEKPTEKLWNSKRAADVTEADMTDLNAVYAACHAFWGMQPIHVAKEVGCKSPKDIKETGWQVFQTVRAVKEGPK